MDIFIKLQAYYSKQKNGIDEMLKSVEQYLKKPILFEKSKKEFWNDLYISQSIIIAHLNPDIDSATRKHDFVEKSVDWI